MWERGLKHRGGNFPLLIIVAPHVGAWIETSKITIPSNETFVAPHVGAWIETVSHSRNLPILESLPMWERGLKLGKQQQNA